MELEELVKGGAWVNWDVPSAAVGWTREGFRSWSGAWLDGFAVVTCWDSPVWTSANPGPTHSSMNFAGLDLLT